MRRAFAAHAGAPTGDNQGTQAGAPTGDNQGTQAGAAGPEAGQRTRVEEGAAAATTAAAGGGALRLRMRGWAGLAPGTSAGDGDAAVHVAAEPRARALAPSQEQT